MVDSRSVPAHHRAAFLQRVVQRYGRILGITLRDVQLAAQGKSPQDESNDGEADPRSRDAGMHPHGAVT